MTDDEKDELHELIEEREHDEPGFRALFDAAVARRELLDRLAALRKDSGLSQTEVARRMQTSQSTVARLEGGDVNATMLTVERFAIALGFTVGWRLTPVAAAQASSRI